MSDPQAVETKVNFLKLYDSMTIVEYYERPISTIVIIHTTRLLDIYHPSFHGSATVSHQMNAYKMIMVSGGTG
jgi:hypothetical protein